MAKPVQQFDVIIRTTALRLPVILQALDGSAQLISVTAVDGAVPQTQPNEPKQRHSNYVGGVRDKGISSEDLAMQCLTEANGKPVPFSTIAQRFANSGFAGNSSSPALSQLKAKGKIKNLGKGMWQLVTGE